MLGTVVRGIGNGEACDGEDPYAKKLLKESLLPSVGEGQDEGEEIVKVKSVNRPSTAKARTLRRKFTDAEQKLWNHLRGRQISGEKFRRQQPLGRYVVDFVCLEKKLIVEVDGGHHAASANDEERTSWLESEGFRVVRFWNNEVLKDVGVVLDVIYEELKNEDVSPSPWPYFGLGCFRAVLDALWWSRRGASGCLLVRIRSLKGEGEILAVKVRIGTSAIGEKCSDTHSIASIPSRERVKEKSVNTVGSDKTEFK